MSEVQEEFDEGLKGLRIDPTMKGNRSTSRRQRRPWLMMLIAALIVGGGLLALSLVRGRTLEVSTLRITPQTDAPENSAAAVLVFVQSPTMTLRLEWFDTIGLTR